MMVYVLARAVNFFVEIIVLMIVAEALMSWFVRPGSSGYRVYVMLENLTEPVIRPFRKLTQGIAHRSGMDFAPAVAIIALYVIRKVVISLMLLLV